MHDHRGTSVILCCVTLIVWFAVLVSMRSVLVPERFACVFAPVLIIIPLVMCTIHCVAPIASLGKEQVFARTVPTILFGLGVILATLGSINNDYIDASLAHMLLAVIIGSVLPHLIVYIVPLDARPSVVQGASDVMVALQSIAFALVLCGVAAPLLVHHRRYSKRSARVK